MTVNVDSPYGFDHRGRTAEPADADAHILDMIELLLFTAPTERVNRPDFGSGLMQLVFAPNSPELAAALEYTTHAGLQRWLGDVIDVADLSVRADDAILRVQIRYSVRRTGQMVTAELQRPVG